MAELDEQEVPLLDPVIDHRQATLVDELFGAAAILGVILHLHLIAADKALEHLSDARLRIGFNAILLHGGIARPENGGHMAFSPLSLEYRMPCGADAAPSDVTLIIPCPAPFGKRRQPPWTDCTKRVLHCFSCGLSLDIRPARLYNPAMQRRLIPPVGSGAFVHHDG